MTAEVFNAPFKGRSLLNWIDWTPDEINIVLNIALQVKKEKKAGLKAGTTPVQYGSRYNSTTIYLGGDVIIGVNGISVTSLADYYSILESTKPGDTITLNILRNNKEMNLTIQLDQDQD